MESLDCALAESVILLEADWHLDSLFQSRIDPWPAKLLPRCYGPLKPQRSVISEGVRASDSLFNNRQAASPQRCVLARM